MKCANDCGREITAETARVLASGNFSRVCKVCYRKQQKAWMDEHREEVREKNRKAYRKWYKKHGRNRKKASTPRGK